MFLYTNWVNKLIPHALINHHSSNSSLVEYTCRNIPRYELPGCLLATCTRLETIESIITSDLKKHCYLSTNGGLNTTQSFTLYNSKTKYHNSSRHEQLFAGDKYITWSDVDYIVLITNIIFIVKWRAIFKYTDIIFQRLRLAFNGLKVVSAYLWNILWKGQRSILSQYKP